MTKRLTNDEYEYLGDMQIIISVASASIDAWHSAPHARTRLRTWVSWNSLALMSHHAGTLCVAMKSRQIYSGQAILRILIEQYINLHYIHLTRSYESFVRFLYHGDVEFIEGIERYRRFTHRVDYDGDFDDDLFDEIRSYRDETIRELKRYGYPLRKMPDLRTRAELVDRKHGNYALEELYTDWYIIHSIDVHGSKDTMIAMTHAESLDELMTGYRSKEDTVRLMRIANQLLASALLYVHEKSGLRMVAPPDHIALIKSIGGGLF